MDQCIKQNVLSSDKMRAYILFFSLFLSGVIIAQNTFSRTYADTICNPSKSTHYTLRVTSRLNCIAQDSVTITIIPREPVSFGINCTRTE